MTTEQCRAFSITVSVKGDITPDEGNYFVHMMKKSIHYAGGCGILEYSTGSNPKWHFHGAFFVKHECKLSYGRSRAYIKDSLFLKNILKGLPTLKDRYDPRHAVRVDPIYNNDWCDKYLVKEESSVLLMEDYPDNMDTYYVPEAIQKVNMARSLNPEFEQLDELLKEFIENFEPWNEKSENWKNCNFQDKEAIEHFLKEMWFSQRKIRVPAQVRQMKEKVHIYYAWISGGSIQLL